MSKSRITVTVEKELLEWLDQKVSERIFANRSHGLEILVRNKRNGKD